MTEQTREALEAKFLNAEKLYTEINELVSKGGLTYMEATIQVCESKQIDLEDIKRLKLVSPILMDKLLTEGTASGLLKPSATLPI